MSDDSKSDQASMLTQEEANEARRLFEALQAFRGVYPDMTVAQAAALLLAASSREPLSMSGIRSNLGVAASTATRAVLTLSQGVTKGSKKAKTGLVEQSVDPKDRRWRFAHCTPFGIATVREALSKLQSSGAKKKTSSKGAAAKPKR